MRPTGVNKLTNEYVRALPSGLYEDIPKAVWAAIAVSALSGRADDLSGEDFWAWIGPEIAREWGILNANGIVPQAVPAKWREGTA